MKLNDLVGNLESSRKAVSEAKIKIATLLALNNKDFDEKDQEKFNSVIDDINKMISNVYTGIKYKIKFEKFSDNTPYFHGKIDLKVDYCFKTQMSLCVGMLSKIKEDLESTASITNLFDANSMTQLKIKPTFNKARKLAVKDLDSLSENLSEFFLEEEDVESAK